MGEIRKEAEDVDRAVRERAKQEAGKAIDRADIEARRKAGEIGRKAEKKIEEPEQR